MEWEPLGLTTVLIFSNPNSHIGSFQFGGLPYPENRSHKFKFWGFTSFGLENLLLFLGVFHGDTQFLPFKFGGLFFPFLIFYGAWIFFKWRPFKRFTTSCAAHKCGVEKNRFCGGKIWPGVFSQRRGGKNPRLNSRKETPFVGGRLKISRFLQKKILEGGLKTLFSQRGK